MKRMLALFMILLALTIAGCTGTAVETPETTVGLPIAVSEATSNSEPAVIDETEPEGEETCATSGHCVDCGALISDPASFDPYHCAGCGTNEFFYCESCWKFIPCVDSIHRMCVDCYWTSGNGGFCVICGEKLDICVGKGMVCAACYDHHGENIHRAMLQPQQQECYLCHEMTMSGAYLRNGEFACSECVNAPVPEYAGRCHTCGKLYADGEGFESLCYDCQDKYGPKCSICGTDCTYRGTIDGMCDDCWESQSKY